ncbi:MAG: Ada metal-binding domain-containing protein, partial [Terriglobus sp.]
MELAMRHETIEQQAHMKRTAPKTIDATNDAQTTQNDTRWQAVLHRDRSADGTFVYGVRSTGIFCRPGCSSRTPLPENVRFYANPDEAIRAGFRPCQRCKPDQRTTPFDAIISTVCRAIESAIEAGDPIPQLDTLAQQAGLSKFHLHRQFRAATG